MLKKQSFCLYLLFTVLGFTASTTNAAPWIKATDISARQHVEFLVSSGVITAPITQWPLMWGSILPDLRRAQYHQLKPEQKQAVNSLMAKFEQDSAPAQFSARAGWGDQNTTVFGGFGRSNDSPQYAGLSAAFVGQHWAAELNVGYDIPDQPREHRKLDGSYLARAFGNWGITLGAIDRWWGPGWQSSLILSNNARPVPAISLQRTKAQPFDSPWLAWLGPWQLQAFIGQLESDRAVPEAKLLGFRIAFKPLQWLELGATRTAQWGGEGRPESFSTFKDLVLGKDNRGSQGISQDNEPGNQLAGVDLKASFAVPWGSQGIYFQVIGEDEAGYAPSRYIYNAGVDGVIVAGQHQRLHWFFERSDTAANALDEEKRFNYAYEHSAYRSGYRYLNRALGASVDSDSTINTFAISWLLPSDQRLNVKWSKINLNVDSNRNTGFSGKGDVAEMSYTSLWHSLELEIGYRHIGKNIQALGLDNSSTIFINTTWRW